MTDSMSVIERMAGQGGLLTLVSRWVFEFSLTLETAACPGAGYEGDVVDMPVLRDADGNILLPGSSIAGGLRSHLCDRLFGYYAREDPDSVVGDLFGPKVDPSDPRARLRQSRIIVEDAYGTLPEGRFTDIRDGVKIDGVHGTAEDHKKFDFELLPPGTTFAARVEIAVDSEADEQALLAGALAALDGFTDGEIPVGARDSRGFGKCKASEWKCRRYDLSSWDGWREWLAADPTLSLDGEGSETAECAARSQNSDVQKNAKDERRWMRFDLDLKCKDGLLIGSPNPDPEGPDSRHIRSGDKPILTGTGLVGAMRLQATRIAKLIKGDPGVGLVDKLFGPSLEGTKGEFVPKASRLRAAESPLTDGFSLHETRIRIDRFTGGVFSGALLEEEPVYRSGARCRLELRNPKRCHAGLMVLVIKDLLDGLIPVGGTVSVGRGILTGSAVISESCETGLLKGTLHIGEGLKVEDEQHLEVLNGLITALHDWKPKQVGGGAEE